MSRIRAYRSDNLRPAPPALTPTTADRLVALAEQLCPPIQMDASIAPSGRTCGDSPAPLVAAVEAGRDIGGRR